MNGCYAIRSNFVAVPIEIGIDFPRSQALLGNVTVSDTFYSLHLHAESIIFNLKQCQAGGDP